MPESTTNISAEVSSIEMRLISFEVKDYVPLEPDLIAYNFNFQCSYTLETAKIDVEIAINTSDIEKKGNAFFKTLTVFEVIGMNSIIQVVTGQLSIPEIILSNAVSTAFATTRGALAERSNGKILVPLMNLSGLLPKPLRS